MNLSKFCIIWNYLLQLGILNLSTQGFFTLLPILYFVRMQLKFTYYVRQTKHIGIWVVQIFIDRSNFPCIVDVNYDIWLKRIFEPRQRCANTFSTIIHESLARRRLNFNRYTYKTMHRFITGVRVITVHSESKDKQNKWSNE